MCQILTFFQYSLFTLDIWQRGDTFPRNRNTEYYENVIFFIFIHFSTHTGKILMLDPSYIYLFKLT